MSFAVWVSLDIRNIRSSRTLNYTVSQQDYFCGLFYTRVKGLDAIQVMLRFMPQTIGGFVGGISANYLLRKISTQIVFCLG